MFVPALAMRAWSAGHDDRALEFAMSLPLGDGALVAGKFLAGLVVLAFVLLLAMVFPATVFYLGEPDPAPRPAPGSPRSRCWRPSTPSPSVRPR